MGNDRFEYASYLMRAERAGAEPQEAVVSLPAGYETPMHAWSGDERYELVRRLDEARGGRLSAFRNRVVDEEIDVFVSPHGLRLSKIVFADGTDAAPVWCTNVSMFTGAGHVSDAARLNADMRERQARADRRMRDSYQSAKDVPLFGPAE